MKYGLVLAGGGEFGQFLEWRFEEQLEWNLLEDEKHQKLMDYVRRLNKFYIENKALWELEQSWDGFKWINASDNENSVLSYIRTGKKVADEVIVVANFTPVDRPIYTIGVPRSGEYEVVIHSNSTKFGGTRLIGAKKYTARKEQYSDMDYSIDVFVDAGAFMILKRVAEEKKK